MKKLVAKYPILHESHQYKIGDELPASNHEMVEVWIKNNVAVWQEDAEEKVQAIGNSSEDKQNDDEKSKEDKVNNLEEEEVNNSEDAEEKTESIDKEVQQNTIGRKNNNNSNKTSNKFGRKNK